MGPHPNNLCNTEKHYTGGFDKGNNSKPLRLVLRLACLPLEVKTNLPIGCQCYLLTYYNAINKSHVHPEVFTEQLPNLYTPNNIGFTTLTNRNNNLIKPTN